MAYGCVKVVIICFNQIYLSSPHVGGLSLRERYTWQVQHNRLLKLLADSDVFKTNNSKVFNWWGMESLWGLYIKPQVMTLRAMQQYVKLS